MINIKPVIPIYPMYVEEEFEHPLYTYELREVNFNYTSHYVVERRCRDGKLDMARVYNSRQSAEDYLYELKNYDRARYAS